jgi:hypothetical protein
MRPNPKQAQANEAQQRHKNHDVCNFRQFIHGAVLSRFATAIIWAECPGWVIAPDRPTGIMSRFAHINHQAG